MTDTTTTALVTTDETGRLTPHSTCMVDGAVTAVPERHSDGGVLAPRRIAEAISWLGWEIVPNTMRTVAGGVTVTVRRSRA